jgi:hypothetical protein
MVYCENGLLVELVLTLDHGPHALLVVDAHAHGERGEGGRGEAQAVVHVHAEVIRVRDARVLAARVDRVQRAGLRALVHHLLPFYMHIIGTTAFSLFCSNLYYVSRGVRDRAKEKHLLLSSIDVVKGD